MECKLLKKLVQLPLSLSENAKVNNGWIRWYKDNSDVATERCRVLSGLICRSISNGTVVAEYEKDDVE